MNRKAFDPSNPFDALADLSRLRVADIGISLCKSDEYRAMRKTPDEQAVALISGLMTGLAGVAMAHADPESHRQVQALLLQVVPIAFNQAREILGLPPLEPLQ